MHIILGATGHVGSALAEALLAKGQPVTVITRHASKTEALRKKGAKVAVVDVFDVAAFQRVLAGGKRLFLLNPPAAPSTDTAAEERRSLRSILRAVQGANLEKIVAESAYGAQPGERIGDLGVLHEMEQALAAQPIPTAVIRAAYYMSNWDPSLQTAQEQGVVHTMYPVDFALPMVAPHDLGQFAARLMEGPAKDSGPHHVEGPEAYTSADVAEAFALALNKPVRAVQTPRSQWEHAFKAMGFSDAGAASYAAMTRVTLDKKYEAENPERGRVSLREYIAALVRRNTG